LCGEESSSGAWRVLPRLLGYPSALQTLQTLSQVRLLLILADLQHLSK
jgi:hypothetical protein